MESSGLGFGWLGHTAKKREMQAWRRIFGRILFKDYGNFAVSGGRDAAWLRRNFSQRRLCNMPDGIEADATSRSGLFNIYRDLAKQAPEGPNLEAIYVFKTLLNEKRYGAAWEAWQRYWNSKFR